MQRFLLTSRSVFHAKLVVNVSRLCTKRDVNPVRTALNALTPEELMEYNILQKKCNTISESATKAACGAFGATFIGGVTMWIVSGIGNPIMAFIIFPWPLGPLLIGWITSGIVNQPAKPYHEKLQLLDEKQNRFEERFLDDMRKKLDDSKKD